MSRPRGRSMGARKAFRSWRSNSSIGVAPHQATKLLEPTGDVGFDGAQGQLQGLGDLGLGEARPVAQGDADPFRLRQLRQGPVEVEAGLVARGFGWRLDVLAD